MKAVLCSLVSVVVAGDEEVTSLLQSKASRIIDAAQLDCSKGVDGCKKQTTTTTTTCDSFQKCYAWGDPHIITFDGYSTSSLLKGSSELRRADNYKNGDFWLVKSKELKIQARLWSDMSGEQVGMSSIRELAISGGQMGFQVLVIEPKYWDGMNGRLFLRNVNTGGEEEILQRSYEDDNLRIVPAFRSGVVTAPESEEEYKDVSGFEIYFKHDDTRKVYVMRALNYLNVEVEVKSSGVEGLCGNLDGDAGNDFAELSDGRTAVSEGERFFHGAPYAFAGCAAVSEATVKTVGFMSTHDGNYAALREACAVSCKSTSAGAGHGGFFMNAMTQAGTEGLNCQCAKITTMDVSDCSAEACASSGEAESGKCFYSFLGGDTGIGLEDCDEAKREEETTKCESGFLQDIPLREQKVEACILDGCFASDVIAGDFTWWNMCEEGDEIECPASPGVMCAGNQCCPDGSACPSASNDFGGCSPKVKNCLSQVEQCRLDKEGPFKNVPGIDDFCKGHCVEECPTSHCKVVLR